MFYEVAGNTLTIHANQKSPIPKRFNSRINVVQVDLDEEDINLLREQPEKKSLKLIE